MVCFDIKDVAKDYLDYYLNVFLEECESIDMERLESNLYRDCDYYKYIPFGLMDEIYNQLIQRNYKITVSNHRGRV